MPFMRILGLRISPVKSLLSTSANSMSIIMSNRYTRDEYIDYRLQFTSLRSYGTDVRKQWTEDLIARSKHADIEDSWERRRRARATEQFILDAINALGSMYLMNSEFRCANSLTVDMWDEKESCYKYWLSIFGQADVPLVIRLEEELQNSGIPREDFCQSIVDVYFTLKSSHDRRIPSIDVTPPDVMHTADRLNFSLIQRDCLKILFSLNNIYSKKI